MAELSTALQRLIYHPPEQGEDLGVHYAGIVGGRPWYWKTAASRASSHEMLIGLPVVVTDKEVPRHRRTFPWGVKLPPR